MKRSLRYLLSVVLMLALMLTMGTAAFADNAEKELPIEYVSYGVGLPDEPGVDAHGLKNADITIDGVSWKTRVEDDRLYVHVLDLAAAKLLRGCADEAKELGLDYSKLYIEDGLIQVKDDVPAAEAEELRGKLDSLTAYAVIGLVAGDEFDVGNGEDLKLKVKVAGFVTGGSDSGSGAAAGGIDVKGIDPTHEIDIEAEANAVTSTTLFVVYYGYTEYGYWTSNETESAAQKAEESAEKSEGSESKYEYKSESERGGGVFLAKAAGDTNQYYVKIEGIDGGNKFIKLEDFAKADLTGLDERVDGEVDKDGNYVVLNLHDKNGNIGSQIIVATDEEGSNVVMEVTLRNETPGPEEFYQEKTGEGGDTWLEPVVPENEGDNYCYVDDDDQYTPEFQTKDGKGVEVENKTSDTADVILRDDVDALRGTGRPE